MLPEVHVHNSYIYLIMEEQQSIHENVNPLSGSFNKKNNKRKICAKKFLQH
jgi:hypothetical protein